MTMSKSLSEQVAELEAENAELRAGQGCWPEKVDDFTEELKGDLLHAIADAISGPVRPTTPRTITADELREGQLVAVYSDRRGVAAGVVYDLEPDVFRLDPGFHHSRTRYRPWMLSAIHGETIVLLQDAPQPTSYADDDFPCCSDTPVTAETIRASEPGSTWEDRHGVAWEWTGGGMAYHSQFGDLGEESLAEYVVQQSGPFTRSTAAPRGDYDTPPRLTVHKLNVAPVGSVVRNARGLGWTKMELGMWAGALGLQTWSGTELLAIADSDATLTYPGDQ